MHQIFTHLYCCFLWVFFFGRSIFCPKSIVHLGHVLTYNLMDNAEIISCSRDSVSKQMVSCLGLPIVLTRLLLNYCMSLYGCALWSLNCSEIKHLDVCLNKCL